LPVDIVAFLERIPFQRSPPAILVVVPVFHILADE
jgi:hypothetical protein